MSYDLKIEIMRLPDKKIAAMIDEGQEYHPYIWEEGNFACDCNRALFFYRALDQDEPEDTPCGYEKYFIRASRADTGHVFYDEITERQ